MLFVLYSILFLSRLCACPLRPRLKSHSYSLYNSYKPVCHLRYYLYPQNNYSSSLLLPYQRHQRSGKPSNLPTPLFNRVSHHVWWTTVVSHLECHDSVNGAAPPSEMTQETEPNIIQETERSYRLKATALVLPFKDPIRSH